ncbi:MAG: RluA family pseudouridine synthase [Aureliella sp.]
MTRNLGYSYRLQLDKKAIGHTTLSFLSSRFRHSTEAEWAVRIEEGQVLVNDKIAEESQLLLAGMIMIWNRPGWTEEETPQKFAVEFEDEQLLAVSKPSGLPTLPGAGFYLNTLLNLVRSRYPSARPLHRLGRGTSGLVLFALTHEAARSLTRGWEKVEKQYQALGSFHARHDEYDIRSQIGLMDHPRLGRVYAAVVDGKQARSVARPLKRCDNSTLFEIDLHTGRPHQIRIHLATIGHPLVGDPLYARDGQLLDSPGLPGDLGYLLHAKRLELEHPFTHKRLEIWSELPQELIA